MATAKITLTTKERIDRLIKSEGRKQSWVVLQLGEMGCEMSEPVFSQKKTNDTFTENELKALTKILPGFTY